jgi:hypothetical protein
MMPPAWPQRISDRILLANRALNEAPKLGEGFISRTPSAASTSASSTLTSGGHILALSLGRPSRKIAVVIFLVPAAVARDGAA